MSEHDPILSAYGEWLNELLFRAELGEGEFLMWLGESRWALCAPEGPEVFLIEMKRAEVKAQ